ncbi:unnamed protein product, partial [Rotaria sp. Silwood2]
MLNLRINNSIYLLLTYQFDCLLWTQRQWFFTHEHNRQKQLDHVILYSRDPYRRKDYTFYSKFYRLLYSRAQD